MDSYHKYKKYKNKYLRLLKQVNQLKVQSGGGDKENIRMQVANSAGLKSSYKLVITVVSDILKKEDSWNISIGITKKHPYFNMEKITLKGIC